MVPYGIALSLGAQIKQRSIANSGGIYSKEDFADIGQADMIEIQKFGGKNYNGILIERAAVCKMGVSVAVI